MKNIMRRFFAIALALIMCVSLLPAAAFAEEPGDEEVLLEEQTPEVTPEPTEEPEPEPTPEVTPEPTEEPVPEPTPVVTPEPTVAPSPVAVRVSFNCTPAETLVWVYAAADEGTELEPEEDGSFLLAPGAYTYVAFCEGYTGLYEDFIVGDEESRVVIEVVLQEGDILEATPMSASASEITQQIKDTYQAALRNAGRTAFQGYCGMYVNWQLVILGINSSYVGADGNQEFDTYKNMSTSSGGYSITAYPASSYTLSSSLNAISANGTKDVYNILVGFETGSGSDGALYGHTCFIHAIIGGTVYFSESFYVPIGGGYSEGSPIACSISDFCNYYDSWTTLDGLIHFSSGEETTDYLSKCDYYPAYLEVSPKNGLHEVWSLPCSDQTDPESSVIYNTAATLTVTGLYKNSVTTSDHYWYRVSLPDGQTGYVYAPYCAVKNYHENDIKNGITYSGKEIPTSLPVSKSYDVDWTIKSSCADLSSISGYIGSYGDSISFGRTDQIRSKNLLGTAVDMGMKFNYITSPGTYPLTIKAKVVNYYCEDGTNNLKSKTLEKTVINSNIAFVEEGHSHSYSSTVVAPTCTEQGYTEYTCSCGASYRDNYTSAKGHRWVDGTITVEPTCTEQGERIDTCSACSAARTTILSSLGHDYTEIIIPGSCTQRPGTRYICSRCEESYTIWDEGGWSEWSTEYPSDHAEEDIQSIVQYRYRDKEITTSDSESLDGWIFLSSEEVWGEYGSWSNWSRTYVAASDSTQVETAPLYRYYYFLCNGCGDHNPLSSACGCGSSSNTWNERDSTIPYTQCNSSVVSYATSKRQTTSLGDGQLWYFSSGNLNDTAVGTVDAESTSTVINQGYRYRTRTQSTVYTFYRWGEWSEWLNEPVAEAENREIETRTVYRYDLYADGQHSWDAGTITSQPTCTTEGEKIFTCSACGETRTEVVSATGHTAVTDAAVAATCTTAGKTEGSHCSVCNAVIKAQTTIPATGHTEVTDPAVAATCTTAGKTEGSHCSVCEAVIKAQTTIPATGHIEVTDAAVAATCTTAGKTEGSHCSVCNEVIKAQTTIPATGHTEVTDPAVAATCTTEGKTEGSHCSVCGEVIVAQEVVPATGHSFGEWIETKAPSLTEDGEETRSCQNSGCDVSETRAVKAVIYTISYDANGGTDAPEAQQKLKGAALTLSSTKPTYSGFTFKGWALTSTATTAAYAPGASYTADESVTLYAVWENDTPINGEFNGSAAQVDANGNLLINEVNFPNEKFRNFISTNYDTAGTGYLTVAQVDAVTRLDCRDMGIADLKGVEYFTSLTHLICFGNRLSTLDVSKNTALILLMCEENQLKELDVSKNTALTDLYCYSNQLTELDVQSNTELKYLECQNNGLTELNVSANTALKVLRCNRNQLTTLDLSQNTALSTLQCFSNQLTSLELSYNTNMSYLSCSRQTSTASAEWQGSECVFDLGTMVGSENLDRVTDLTGGTYDSSTGIVTLDIEDGATTATVVYNYDHQSVKTEPIMDVTVNITVPEKPSCNHVIVTDPAVAATCTTEGKTEGSHCSVCNTVIKAQTTIPATGHTEVTDAAVAATCTTEGKTEGSHCSVCNEVIKAQTTIPATGHTEVKDAAVAATCTTEGKTEGSHCSVCNEVIKAQTTIPATGHTEVTDAAVAATCTTAGKTEGSHCSACGEVIVAQEVVPATGHSFGEWTETKAPSLTEDGEETRSCQNPGCDVSETRAVKAVIYTISYDANGGSGAPAAQQKLKGTALTLSTTKPTLSGYTFKGWAMSKTATTVAYAPGASYTEDADATLYAVWEKDVVVDENDPAIVVSSVKVRPGEEVDVTLSLQNNPGIVGMTLKFEYDKTAMTLVSMTESGLEGTWQKISGITWASSSGDSSYNGVFLTLRFAVNADAAEGEYQVKVLYEEGDICNNDLEDVNFAMVPGTVTVKNRIPGDVNGDDKVNTKDFITLMKHLAGDDIYCVPDSTDINGDGKVNTKDFITLMKYLAGEDIAIH